jgi:PEP-CTERM motif
MKMKNAFCSKTALTVALVAGMAVLTQVQTAQAQANFTTSDTLADLISPTGTYNGLAVGDKIVTGFTALPHLLTGFDPADIQVTLSEPVANQYILTWEGSIGVAASGINLSDLLLNYTVTATDGNIFAIDQSYTGTGSVPGASLDVKETVTAPGSVVILASSELTYAITNTDYNAVGAILNPGQTSLSVTKDISFSTLNGGTIFISQIEQSFEEVAVPEPASVGLVAFGLAALAGFQGLKRKMRF